MPSTSPFCRSTDRIHTEWSTTLTHDIAYRWHADLYCEGDIVAVLTERFPWYVWLDLGNQPATEDSETELDDIATLFRLDRKDFHQLAQCGFPIRLPRLPVGACAACRQPFRLPTLPIGPTND